MALLRAAVLTSDHEPAPWPDPADGAECRAWLSQVWASTDVAAGMEQASPTLADGVAAILAETTTDHRRDRRAVLATARHLLRATGRPTPFGLFAGVADVHVTEETRVEWGNQHRSVARADTQWLADVIDRLEACPRLLERVGVLLNNLATRRGDRLELQKGSGRVSVNLTPAVRSVCGLTATPVQLSVLVDRLVANHSGADRAGAGAMLASLLRHGILVSELRAPSTCVDPLGHLLDRLSCLGAERLADIAPLVQELTAVRTGLQLHNQSTTGGQRAVRATVSDRMRRISTAGRSPLAVDVRLDANIRLSVRVVAELEHAATALLRLTRHPTGFPAWISYHAAFRDRYGIGTLVPLHEVLDPDAGLGYPAGYPGSVLPAFQAADAATVQHRDAQLLALAWAGRDGTEIELSDADVRQFAGAAVGIDERWVPPHVELAARVRASSPEAIDRGEFTVLVAPARAGGTLTSRFTATAAGDGLHKVYRDLPAAAAGALPVQLSFPPAYPHAENVCRVPAYLSDVLSLGEHSVDSGEVFGSASTNSPPRLLPMRHLALTATADRLHLVDMANGRFVEPQVFHALALDKQAPPLARFLAHLPRAWAPAWTVFDWGPHADALPYLPAVRYRRCILTPARWRVTAADLSDRVGGGGSDLATWRQALQGWRHRWGCSQTVDLRDEDRSLRLRLNEPMHAAILRAHLERHGAAVLTDPGTEPGSGWMEGHAHEIAVPLVRIDPPPAPDNAIGPGTPAIVTNRTHRQAPGGPDTRWLYAKLYTHPDRQDGIIADHLPQLIADLGEGSEHAPIPCWFVRYRSQQETDHLRVRIRLSDPGRFGTYAIVVGRWTDKVSSKGLARGLTFDSYQPEVGRYGTGAALTAVEELFVADSQAVATDLRHLSVTSIDRTALAAVGMVHLVGGLLGEHAGLAWLTARPTHPLGHHRAGRALEDHAAIDRTVNDQTVRAVRSGCRPELLGWPAEVTTAWDARADTIATYAHHLNGEPAAVQDRVVESLLHMHHNRAFGVDPAHERRCRQLARRAAIATLAWPGREPHPEHR